MTNAQPTGYLDLPGALAWPIVTMALALLFRRQLVAMAQRLKTVSIGSLALILDSAEQQVRQLSIPELSEPHIQLSAQEALIDAITRQAKDATIDDLRGVYSTLAREYESKRAAHAKSTDRTRSLERVAAKMRVFGRLSVSLVPELAGSASPGKKLCAITILQVSPSAVFLDWLRDRFLQESGFLAYHAAVAIRSITRTAPATDWERILTVIRVCLESLPLDSAQDRKETLLEAREELSRHHGSNLDLPVAA